MNWVVFQIASGRAFFVAVACLVAAVLLHSGRSPRARRVSTWSLVAGLITLSVAAAPIPYWAYALVGVAILVGLSAGRFGTYAAMGRAGAALMLAAVALHEARYHRMPVLRPAPARRIAVIGDSITAGNGADDPTRKWPAILRDQHGVTVQDLSRAGATAASAAKQLQHQVIDAPVVIVEIGGNDFLGGGSVRGFEEGLESLLEAISKPGRQIAMFELPIPPLYEGFGRVQRDLAARYGVALIPKRILLSVVGATGATVDSIHLTQQGHDRMAGFVWALVEPALPDGPEDAARTEAMDSR